MYKFIQSKKTIATFVLVASITANYIAQSYSSGAPTAGYTNAPGDGNCTSCHSGAGLQTSGVTHGKISLGFNTGTLEYIPDSTYTVSLSVSHGSFNKFGFQTTVLDKNNKAIGTLTAGSGNQKLTANSREYLTHTSAGNSGSSGAKTWDFTWKAPSTNVGDVTFYMCVNTANGSGSGGDSIFAKKFTITPSSKLPATNFGVSSKSICIGDTLYCSDSSTNNPTAWSWAVTPTTGITPSPTSTDQNPKFVFSKAATYKVKLTATNGKGKGQPDSTTIVVFAPPTISLTSPKTTICQGGIVYLKATYTSGSTLLWNTGSNADSISVDTTGTYSAVATNGSGCTANSNSITINVSPLPQVSLSQTTSGNSFCSKDTITFAATTGMSSYNFMVNATSMQNSTSNTYKLTGMSGSLDVKLVADSNGCTSNTSNTVNVNPTAQLAAPPANCQSVSSTSITWAWTAVTGAKGYEVSEDGGSTWITPSSGSSGTTHGKTGLNSGQSYTILIRATDNAPCNLGKVTSISCFTGTCVTTTYQVKNNTTACEGKKDTILVTPGNAANFAITYNGGTATSSTKFIYTVANGANVIPVEIFDSAQLGCPTAKFNVTVNSYKPTTPTLTPDKAKVCMPKDAPVTFTVTPAGGNSYKLYDSLGKELTTISSGNTYQSSDETELMKLKKATQLDASGCESNPSVNASVQVVTDPKLTLTSTLLDGGYTYQFIQTNNGGYQAGWTYGDGDIGSGDSVTHKYTKNGLAIVEVSITKDGCKYRASDSLTIVKVGMATLQENNRVYPNPFANEVILELEAPAKSVIMFDAQGRVVIKLSENELNGKYFILLATTPLPFGVYLLQTETENGTFSRRLVKVSE